MNNNKWIELKGHVFCIITICTAVFRCSAIEWAFQAWSLRQTWLRESNLDNQFFSSEITNFECWMVQPNGDFPFWFFLAYRMDVSETIESGWEPFY